MSSETARVEAFSDGVFAIAITLLVLDIHVPAVSAGPLGPALARQWPTYVAFLISFAFIGIMWVNHHRLFNHIRRTDNALMFLNLLLLLGVTVVPFPTALLAAHYSAGDRVTAAAVFNGTYVLIAVAYNLLWYHAINSGLIDTQASDSAADITRRYGVGPISYLICLGVTWISVPASLALNVGLAIFFAMPAKAGSQPKTMHTATK
ncbi:MAG TPA: TMEM175 family protein [Terriglobales bacterium]